MTRLVLLLAACSAAPSSPVVGNSAPKTPPVLVLRLERTECLADCPEYTVDIASDGSVLWHGSAAVAVLGDARGQIPVAEVQRLVDTFTAAKFFELTDKQRRFNVQYINGKPVTVICAELDEPGVKVTIVRDGKPITHEWQACMDALDRADRLVDTVVGTGRWIGPRR